ncbi:ig family protein [Stylonychia lemnae]|uniref:Ig family protein n=1 Tax=Stylonychia lemnae TaxID=5949 RepID=A0A077ZW94_STYLE|nr:ig family protein [Stylonychia lemnae]|eukprot:CDW73535.1 ig family protein [Stylonychia lemnae]
MKTNKNIRIIGSLKESEQQDLQIQQTKRNLVQCNAAPTFYLLTYTHDDYQNTYNNAVTSDPVTDDIFVLGTYNFYSCLSSGSYKSDCILQKFSPYGDRIYMRTFGLNQNTDDTCAQIKMSVDKYLYVVGSSNNQNTGDYDATFWKINPLTSNMVWAKRLHKGADYGYDLEIQDDGGVIYFTGQTTGFEPNWDSFIIKLDDKGNQLWLRAWASSTWESILAMSLSLMGKYIYLAGSTSAYFDGSSHGMQDAMLMKLHRNGDYQWGLYEGNDGVHDFYRQIASAKDDQFTIACGTRNINNGGTDQRVLITRYSPDGTRTHSFEYGKISLEYIIIGQSTNTIEGLSCALSIEEKTITIVGWTKIAHLYQGIKLNCQPYSKIDYPDQMVIRVSSSDLSYIIGRQFDVPYAHDNRIINVHITSSQYLIIVGREDYGECRQFHFLVKLNYQENILAIMELAIMGMIKIVDIKTVGAYSEVTLPTAYYKDQVLSRLSLVSDLEIKDIDVCTCTQPCQDSSNNYYRLKTLTTGSLVPGDIDDIIVELGETKSVQLTQWCSISYTSPSYTFDILDSLGVSISSSAFYSAFITFTDTSPSTQRTLTLTPTLATQVGTYYLNMKATIAENSGHKSGKYFRVIIQDPEKPLYIKNYPADQKPIVGKLYSLDFSNTFSQTCSSWRLEQLIISAFTAGLPTWLFFDVETSILAGIPLKSDYTGVENPFYLKITCYDDQARNNSVSVQFTITNNQPSILQTIPSQILQVGRLYDYQIPSDYVTDIDGHQLTYNAILDSSDPLPDWLFFDKTTGRFFGFPQSQVSAHTLYTIILTLQDNYGGQVQTSFSLILNEAPTINNGGIPESTLFVYNGQGSIFVDLSKYFKDTDLDQLYYQIEQTNYMDIPSFIIFDQITGILNITQIQTIGGIYRLRMTASDTYQSVCSQNFQIIFNTLPQATPETVIARAYLDRPFAFQFNTSHLWDYNDNYEDMTITASMYDVIKGAIIPAWLQFAPFNQMFYGTAFKLPKDDGYSGNTLSFTVKAVDQYGSSASFRIDIIVIENHYPVVTKNFTNLSLFSMANFVIDISSHFYDEDDDLITYYISDITAPLDQLPNWILWDAQNLRLVGSALNYANNVTLLVRCIDIVGFEVNTTFTIETKLPRSNPKSLSPQVYKGISNMTYYLNEYIEIILPLNIFKDPYGSSLSYAVQKYNKTQDQSDFYDWLSFNSENRTINGLAKEIGEYQIKVEAQNYDGRVNSTNFFILVKEDPLINESRIKIAIVSIIGFLAILVIGTKMLDDAISINQKANAIKKVEFERFQKYQQREDNFTFPPNPVINTRIEPISKSQ